VNESSPNQEEKKTHSRDNKKIEAYLRGGMVSAAIYVSRDLKSLSEDEIKALEAGLAFLKKPTKTDWVRLRQPLITFKQKEGLRKFNPANARHYDIVDKPPPLNITLVIDGETVLDRKFNKLISKPIADMIEAVVPSSQRLFRYNRHDFIAR
jgi:hypothetical protein